MMTPLRTYRPPTYRPPLRAALALALLVSAALPTLRYACDVIGETTDVSIVAVAGHAGAHAMPVCERHGEHDGPCTEGDCTMTAEEAQSPASLSNAPRLVPPQPLAASALAFFAWEGGPEADAPEGALWAGASHEKAPPERLAVRLRTSAYLL